MAGNFRPAGFESDDDDMGGFAFDDSDEDYVDARKVYIGFFYRTRLSLLTFVSCYFTV